MVLLCTDQSSRDAVEPSQGMDGNSHCSCKQVAASPKSGDAHRGRRKNASQRHGELRSGRFGYEIRGWRYGGGMRRNDKTHTVEQILSAVHRERERG